LRDSHHLVILQKLSNRTIRQLLMIIIVWILGFFLLLIVIAFQKVIRRNDSFITCSLESYGENDRTTTLRMYNVLQHKHQGRALNKSLPLR